MKDKLFEIFKILILSMLTRKISNCFSNFSDQTNQILNKRYIYSNRNCIFSWRFIWDKKLKNIFF